MQLATLVSNLLGIVIFSLISDYNQMAFTQGLLIKISWRFDPLSCVID